MYRRIFVICCITFVALTLSGCIGWLNNSPVECKNETPFTGIHDQKTPGRHKKQKIFLGYTIAEVPIPKASTKTEFLSDWGKPDEITPSSKNVETWIYKRKLWCGAIPFIGLPLPLILPVCEGFDRIEFQGNAATLLYTRHTASNGFVFIFPFPLAGLIGQEISNPGCRCPIPTGPAYTKGDKIPDNAGLIFIYRQVEEVSGPYYDVNIGKTFMARLYTGSYYPYLSTLGEKEFLLEGFSKGSVSLNVRSGQTYYIKIEEAGFFKSPSLKVVDKVVAESEIAGCMLITSP